MFKIRRGSESIAPLILNLALDGGLDKVTTNPYRYSITMLRTKNLYALYSSPNIIQVIRSRIMRWASHVARKGRDEVHTGLWWRNLREGVHLENPGVDGRIII